MRVTERDIRLVKDMALSHVLSRDQLIALGYFSSVTRANTRTRLLRNLGLITIINTPYFGQSLYTVGAKAKELVGDRIAPIIAARSPSPRFLQHALSLTNVRVALLSRGATAWRFEQQLRTTFRFAGRDYDVRPDGMAVTPKGLIAVEADLGHVAPAKFREKLRAYDAFVASGECQRCWHEETFRLLTVTTAKLRASRLSRLTPPRSAFEHLCQTYDQIGVTLAGGWS